MTRLPGPAEIIRHQLPNGLVILALVQPELPFACLSLEVAAGSRLDQPAEAGLAGLTASALRRGTKRRTATELFIETDRLGIELSSGSGADVATVDVRSLVEDLPRALAIVAEVAREPAFAEDEVEKLRRETVARLQEAENSSGYVVERELRRHIFPPEKPYRLPVSGYPDTVGQLTAAAVEKFHRDHYGPQGSAIAVVGNFNADGLLKEIEALFGDWTRPGQDPSGPGQTGNREAPRPGQAPTGSAAAEGSPREPVRIGLPGKSQSEIALGGPGPSRSHPHYEALSVANLILGRMGLGGRIGANVRERLGMAYSAYSTLVIYEQAGYWMVRAGVAPDNVGQVIEAILAELGNFVGAPVTDQELADAKGFLLGSLPLRLERAAGLVGLLLSMERHNLGLDYLQRYSEIIGGLTAADLLAAAQEHIEPLASRAVVVGPR